MLDPTKLKNGKANGLAASGIDCTRRGRTCQQLGKSTVIYSYLLLELTLPLKRYKTFVTRVGT